MASISKIINSRAGLVHGLSLRGKVEAEGGCGVIGLACSEQILGRHLLKALVQMKNRGNGKGGGVAALGLSPEKLGVSKEILQEDYLLQIAYLDPTAKEQVETEFIKPFLRVDSASWVETVEDHRSIEGLVIKPPPVRRYFCRVKEEALAKFMQQTGILKREVAEDEFIYQNSYQLNRKFYASLGEKKAFVLSHGKDMMVLKIVGYGDQVVRYYKLEDFPAHVWIGHHRYPTKGKVWHPGGAHPFVGLHEALVHNGDFSNYHSISEYLAQRNIYPLFLTDTEVAVYLFDLWRRVYGYPLEFLIEAMAPTTERDFQMLSEAKRRTYSEVQKAHIHGSPDGPWFFIVGRSEDNGRQLHLLGITDTSMLRPQVFALQDGEAKVGLIASERQAIDACLKSIASEDSRFALKADLYWNARGGSYTDGGAFVFTVDRSEDIPELRCHDKFNREVRVPAKASPRKVLDGIAKLTAMSPAESLAEFARTANSIEDFCSSIEASAATDERRIIVVHAMTWLLDRLHVLPFGKEGRVRGQIESSLFKILRGFSTIASDPGGCVLLDFGGRGALRPPQTSADALLIDVSDFPAEGEHSASTMIVAAYQAGWRHVVSFDWRGQRFCGAGLGPQSDGFSLDVYGNPGDYLGSGLDGAEIYVHASAQDQVAQIMKSGKLVIYGDVGQTFMYAAKGGEVYVLGNAAGRPLINAVGRPRVVINGTCLDYLAESFMAGDPLHGGGFVILNGITHKEDGTVRELETPYPGGNLFSLASGGAIYMRDPRRLVESDQLNGGQITSLTEADWQLILPYLRENENLFGVGLSDLLRISDDGAEPSTVYRKVEAVPLRALAALH